MASRWGCAASARPHKPNLFLVFRSAGRTLSLASLIATATLGHAQGGAASNPPAAQPPAAQTSPAAPQTTPQAPAQTSAPASTPPAGFNSTPMGADPTKPADTPTAAHPATPASAVADSARYVIGAEDVLQITVWNEQKMSGAVPVRPDGMISIPLIGDLPAAGKTPMQLGSDISDQAKKYIQDPNVTVVVTAVNSQRVFLVGEVGKVGPIGLTPGMTPLQAIAAAGGPGPFANVKKIYILRGTGAHQQKIPYNYKQALKGDNRGDVELHPGDTIVIP